MFSPDFFKTNRERLKQLFPGTAPIVLTANGLVQLGGDNTYPFTQDANFWYLSGIERPDILLVIDEGQEYLIVPTLSASRQVFDGEISSAELAQVSGVKTVYDDTNGWDRLAKRLKTVSHVATLASAPDYIESHGFYANPARRALKTKLKKQNQTIKFLDLRVHLARLRMVKYPEEIKAIQTAVDITAQSLNYVAKNIAKYKYEYEIEADLSWQFRRSGGSGHAFSPVVASGERACVIHNLENNSKLNKSDLVIIDTGAEVNHYAADLASTFSLSKPTKRQQAVYQSVLKVQQDALNLLKPGVNLKEYEKQVEAIMAEQLVSLGLVKRYTRANVRQFYPHATSHFLGLNVHDVGDYAQALRPGMVMAVEPGIYIKSEGIGVRVEDDVVITAQGNRVLSSKLAKTL